MDKPFVEPSSRVPSSGLSLRLLSILVLIPALFLAFLIYKYGTDVPYWDQWEEYDLFHRVQHHTLTLQDMFSQHNEHRLFFPRILLIAATSFAPYTDLAELWISWVLACLSSICLWRLARYTGWSNATGHLLLTGANLMLFNCLAWEDWLWGFQVGFLLPVFCIIAGVWSVSVSKGAWRFFWAAWWSVINSFTIASGFVTWIVLIPLLLFPEGEFRFRWKGLLVHLLGLVVCLALYLHGYVKPGGHPTEDGVWQNPLAAINYFLTYLGASLANKAPPFDDMVMWSSFIVGAILVVIYVACIVLLAGFRHRSGVWKKALPWLTLCHYGICSALITTVGRMGFGLEQALSSRYVVFSSLVPMGLIFAGAALFPAVLPCIKRERFRQATSALIVAVPILCLAFHFWTVSQAFTHWSRINDIRLRTKAALFFVNQPSVAPLLQAAAYPSFDQLKIFLNYRSELDYPQKVLDGSDISSLADPSSPDPMSGLMNEPGMATGSNGYALSGWAYLPKVGRPADIILVTLPDSQNRDCIAGMAFPQDYDKNVGTKLHGSDPAPIKWDITLPAGTNLAGLKAWSYDGREGRAYRIATASKSTNPSDKSQGF